MLTPGEIGDDRDTWRDGYYQQRGATEEAHNQVQQLHDLMFGDLENHANQEQ